MPPFLWLSIGWTYRPICCFNLFQWLNLFKVGNVNTLESVRFGKCQNPFWCKIWKCPNLKVSESEGIRTGQRYYFLKWKLADSSISGTFHLRHPPIWHKNGFRHSPILTLSNLSKMPTFLYWKTTVQGSCWCLQNHSLDGHSVRLF